MAVEQTNFHVSLEQQLLATSNGVTARQLNFYGAFDHTILTALASQAEKNIENPSNVYEAGGAVQAVKQSSIPTLITVKEGN